MGCCESALRLAPLEWLPDLPSSKELQGAAQWYPFEDEVWPIGESVRRAFQRHPKLKKNRPLISRVVEVATRRNLRHGRQSFIMALGFVAARDFAPMLAPFLDDADVDGHVIDTLLKMKAAGYSAAVAPLTRSKKTWVRRLANRYVERYS